MIKEQLRQTPRKIFKRSRPAPRHPKKMSESFHLWADSAPVMIWQAGKDKLCIYLNKRWLDFTGRSLEQELGKGWAESVHPQDQHRCWDIYSACFDARKAFSMVYRLRRYDGEYRWILANGNAMYDEKGFFRGYIGSCVDITAQKRAEFDAHESQLALAHMRRVSTIGEMAASIAHELNQPLTAILSNAQAALRILNSETPDYKEVREILSDVIADDKRAGEVIRRLRVLLKKKPLELRPLQMNELIREVVQMLHSDTILRQASIQLELEDNMPLTYGDEVQLQQVLLNLVLNGLDAMCQTPPDHRIISIHSARDGSDRLLVSVKDRGYGIGVQHLGRIFSPFFTTKKEGLGLGLAVTHSIIEGHKGRIWAENNPEEGASFHFSLPVYRSTSVEVTPA